MTNHMFLKQKVFLVLGLILVSTSVVYSEPTISILWEKEISQEGRSLVPYTIKVTDDNILRVIGLSHIPKRIDLKLIEYRINLNTNELSESKNLLPMNEEDITITLPRAAIKDSRLINNKIIIVRNQYKSFDLQELTIDDDGKVKERKIQGLTRSSVSTHGACRNLSGDVYLCGNSGYVRKVGSDGKVAWDTNYKSEKGEDGTLGVAYSESEKVLVAFGMSFEPDTKFTSKDSNLWLANLNSEGKFIAKKEFEGIATFGKTPLFCLSQSDRPIVIYDTNPELKNYNIVVSKFSKDLKKKEWTTSLFKGKDMMVSTRSLIPFDGDFILATFTCVSQKDINSYFYILDKNGKIVNHAALEDVSCVSSLIAVNQNKIYFVTEEYKRENDTSINFLKLICLKIDSAS
ncbi:MAG: hypothetical protein OEV87_04990 [Phycisphaerae bacterium]|nr:hypothetical protein [Phycisphaerae bacterium]